MTWTLLVLWLVGSDWVSMSIDTDSKNWTVCMNKGKEVEDQALAAGVPKMNIRWTCIPTRSA